jgi:hypothetical protein
MYLPNPLSRIIIHKDKSITKKNQPKKTNPSLCVVIVYLTFGLCLFICGFIVDIKKGVFYYFFCRKFIKI